MGEIKVLYDYKPALEKYKVGIPIFVENIFYELNKDSSLKVKKSGIFPSYFQFLPYSLNLFRILYYELFLPLRIIFGKYDVYIENGYLFNPYITSKKVKVITVIHDIGLILYNDIQTEKITQYMRKSLPISIKNSDFIITVSESSKKDIQKYLDRIQIQKPIGVIYNAPVLKKEPEVELSHFKIKGEYFLFLGTLEPRKNPMQMIQGFHSFIGQYNNKIQLVCSGKKGWLYNDVMEYIQENEIEDKVIFTGYVTESEKYWLMKKAIGFIFLSKYEGFGIPPLESLVLGTPVLLNDISVFRELFENDAIYVNANDIREIAEGMNNLLTMKQKSKYKCLEKFNWKKSGEKFSKIIKQLTDKSQKQ